MTTHESALPTVLQLGNIISSSLATLSDFCQQNSLILPEPADLSFSEESEAFRLYPEAADAANVIVAAAFQLAAALLPPKQSIYHISSGSLKTAALRTAIGCHVPEILKEAGPQGLHVDKMAAISNVDGTKLGRLLRLLANHHIFQEVSPDVFANTRISSVLDTGKKVQAILQNPDAKHDNTSGFPALVEHSVTTIPVAASHVFDSLHDPEYAQSEEPTFAPFHHAHKALGAPPHTPMYKWFELPGNEYALRRFGLAMKGIGSMQSMDTILGAYPWGSLPPSSIVVDVGAGIGTSAMLIARAHPHLKIVIQDRDKVVEEARAHWQHVYPEAITEGRIAFQAIDFFQPYPSLPTKFGSNEVDPSAKPSVFLLKNIIHNYSDKYASNILSHVRDAASPESQLLIVGTVMPNLCRQKTQHNESVEKGAEEIGVTMEEAPEPLLPNYGAANEMGYTMDITMMIMHNALERTLGQMQSLLKRTGWRLQKIKRSNPPNNFFDPIIAVPG